MKQKLIIAMALVASLTACSSDKQAYNSCKQTLEGTIKKLPTLKTRQEFIALDKNLNDTLTKYGHAEMSSDMIKEIKALDAKYRALGDSIAITLIDADTIATAKTVKVPGIGEVEFKTPHD